MYYQIKLPLDVEVLITADGVSFPMKKQERFFMETILSLVMVLTVFRRKYLKVFFERGCKFALISVPHSLRYPGDTVVCFKQELGGLFHPVFPCVGGDGISINGFEYGL